ncbi:hypothetical protein GO003_013740 [Methylicorpusculum oleiharenae]|uniref:hypothetical protein n=1 Tax=Methylicorpusculum oleiharenae TaxID=1338687 RepID=UPI001356EABA|nr:hypothetical protein [Methylicorpusculum oleiharenae]MCD2451452.1 hypothetical protein [Methylicorpusculum oleiharenae]
MKAYSQFIPLLLLSMTSPALSAFQVGELDVRGQSELSWQYTPGRSDTVFNPGGGIVDNPENTGFLGLRLTPKFNYSQVTLRGDYWLQSQVTGDETEEKFFIQGSAFDWNVTDSIVVSGGIDIQHWGPGYIWNPSNPFQDREINFEDRAIAYKRHGNLFASADWTGDNNWAATAYFVRHKPREKLYGTQGTYQNAFALKLNKQFDNSDASLTYARLDDMNFIGSSYSITVGSQLELHGEFSLRDKRRTVLPQRITVNSRDSFFIFQEDSQTEWRPQFLIGSQYTTDSQINLIFEYFYNGEAYSEDEYESLVQDADQSAALLNSQFAAPAAGFLGGSNSLLGSMKRHYLFARVADSRLIGDVEAKAFVRYGIQDSSVIAGGLLSYPITDGLDLMLGGQYYGDISGSETADIPFRFVLYSGLTLLF